MTASRDRSAAGNDGWTRPRRSKRTAAQYQAWISIVKAAEEMQREFAELLRGEDLSLAQYNILRILRGAGEAGLACGQVADRLIRHDPDMTRLLDRLEKRALVARTRDASDRRIVRTRATADGLALLARLDKPVDALHEQQMGHMSEDDLHSLHLLAEASRARHEA